MISPKCAWNMHQDKNMPETCMGLYTQFKVPSGKETIQECECDCHSGKELLGTPS